MVFFNVFGIFNLLFHPNEIRTPREKKDTINLYIETPEQEEKKIFNLNLKKYIIYLENNPDIALNKNLTFSGSLDSMIELLEDVFLINNENSQKLLNSFLLLFFEKKINYQSKKNTFQLTLNKNYRKKKLLLDNFLLLLNNTPQFPDTYQKLCIFLASILRCLKTEHKLKTSFTENILAIYDFKTYSKKIKNYTSFAITNRVVA